MKKKYVQVGLGGRARFFYEAIASTYHQTCEPVSYTHLDVYKRQAQNNGKNGKMARKICLLKRCRK